MKTIGSLLKSARREKQLTFVAVEQITKIKKDFIVAIERHNWDQLPEFPVILGFVKNLAQAYGIDRNKAAALLRRDYPPKKLTVNPKPDLKKDFTWSPRLTFIVGVSFAIIGVVVYLVFQYTTFVSPPKLEVYLPQENQTIDGRVFLVTGKTSPEDTVTVNNQPAYIDEVGNFSTEIEISTNTQEIVFRAISRSGKETVVVRHVKVIE
ncbi:hypothetical protein C4564_03290 [Candidatus Microgenomates bacterium]|nr:MAG: hypothetical protein C4564_03290 [Candidatus Microgenomates bacterium]